MKWSFVRSLCSKKKLTLLVSTLLIVAFCSGQCDEVSKIIGSREEMQTKKRKLKIFINSLQHSSSKQTLADCYHDYANKWFFEQWLQTNHNSDLDSAIYYTKKAVEIKTELNLPDENPLKKSTYNLAFFYFQNQDFFKAIDSYLSVLKLGEKDLKTQFATNDLALCYERIGDFEKARWHYRNIIEFYSSQNVLNNKGLIDAYLGLINLYNLMEREALNTEIAESLVSSDSTFRAEGITVGFELGRYYVGKANYFLNLDEFDRAREFYTKALTIETGFNAIRNATIYNNLALCELESGQLKTSEDYALKAIQLSSSFSGPYETLGHIFIEKKDFAKSMRHYQQAINLIMGKTTPIAIIDLPTREELTLAADKLHLLDYLIAKAKGWLHYYKSYHDQGHLGYALDTFKKADELIDIIKRENTEFKSKVYWRERSSEFYGKAVETCFFLNKPKEAFYFMERNKALLLLEDITNEGAKEIAQIPSKKAQQEFNLKQAIFLSENKLEQNTGKIGNDSIAVLKQNILAHKSNYEKFIDSLEKTYPQYAKFKKKANILSYSELKTNYISEKKAVLHYILNENQGYGLLTLPDTTLLFQMNDIPKLNKNVETLIATLSDGISDIGRFQKISNSVFRQLLPENIYGKIKGKQLLIIPDYTLQRIPFEALVVNNDKAPKYLIEDVEIGYAYSASLLEYTQRTERNPANDFVGFAPVQFGNLGLPQLYFSKDEITGIADVYPGETMINGQATKANFLENVDEHKIVHLATHADVGDGENPWIAFSDSKMYLKEIYATRNQADMVVLSACNTSNGALKRGEGVMSLARGFFYSGAKSVVSTLWPVTDEASTDILIGFYKNLDRGDSKSRALQKAKLDYLRSTEEVELKHPYYWAGFIVVGDNAPMVTISYWYWVLLAMGLLVLVLLLFKGKLFKGIQ